MSKKRLFRVGLSIITTLLIIITGTIGDLNLPTANFAFSNPVSIGQVAQAVPDNGKFQLKNKQTGECALVPQNPNPSELVKMGSCQSPDSVLNMQIGGKYRNHKVEYITAKRNGKIYDISMRFQGFDKNPYYYIGENPSAKGDKFNSHRILGDSKGLRLDHNEASRAFRRKGIPSSYCATASGDHMYAKKCGSGMSQRWTINERNLPTKRTTSSSRKTVRTGAPTSSKSKKFKLMNKQTKRCLIIPNNPSRGQSLKTGDCASALAVLEINKNGSYLGRPSLYMTATRGGKTYDVAVADNSKGGIKGAYIGLNPNKSADWTNQFRFIENQKTDTFRLDHNSASRAYKRTGDNHSDCLATDSKGAAFTTRCNEYSNYQSWDTIPTSYTTRNNTDTLIRTGTGIFSHVPLIFGQRRVTYTISEVTGSDVIDFCRKKMIGGMSKAVRKGYEINCFSPLDYDQKSKVGAEFGVDLGVNGAIDTVFKKLGIDLGGDVGISLKVTPETVVKLKRVYGEPEVFSTNQLCLEKHGILTGAGSSKDGNLCLDTYRLFPWE